jgi:membrane dipeptidase
MTAEQPLLPSPLREALVWDNHMCVPLRPGDDRFLHELDRLKPNGVDVCTLNVACGEQSPADAFDMLAFLNSWIACQPDKYHLIRTVADLRSSRSAKSLGVCFDIEGGTALGADIANIARFYDRGVRWMLLTYNRSNALGGGCLGEDQGLTDFGHAVIEEMNQVGMTVCASHSGERTAGEIIRHSKKPVIFSHSNSSRICAHPRNISDALIKACADRGGVVGVNGFGPFLGDNDASTQRLARHIEHLWQVAGEDHVGLGLDYVFDADELEELVRNDPVTFPPDLYSSGAQMFAPWHLRHLVNHLLEAGHCGKKIEKLLGSNLVRIADENWTN